LLVGLGLKAWRIWLKHGMRELDVIGVKREATFVFADESLNCSFAHERGNEDVADAEF
jgi:hypothetical protein